VLLGVVGGRRGDRTAQAEGQSAGPSGPPDSSRHRRSPRDRRPGRCPAACDPGGQGAGTAHVAPGTAGTPAGATAGRATPAKSPAVGGVVSWQSSKLILKRGPGRGEMAEAFTTTSLSAYPRVPSFFGWFEVPDGKPNRMPAGMLPPVPGRFTWPSG